MDFGIIYHTDNSDMTKYSLTAQSACICAFNYMQLHPEIKQATVFDTNTHVVVKVFIR